LHPSGWPLRWLTASITPNLACRLYHGQPKSPGEQVVVLSQVLASEATLGYEEVFNVQVSALQPAVAAPMTRLTNTSRSTQALNHH